LTSEFAETIVCGHGHGRERKGEGKGKDELDLIAVTPLRTPPPPGMMATEDMQERQCDVVIVGAGPSGLVCGSLLARAGHRVVIVERESNPQGRALLLTRFGLQVLEELGWLEACKKMPEASSHDSIKIVSVSEEVNLRVSTGLLTLPQPRAHKMMASNALAEGVSILYGVSAVAPVWDSRRVCGVRARTADGDEVQIQALATIDASGADSFLAAAIGQLQPRTGPRRCRVSTRHEGETSPEPVLAIVDDCWLLHAPGSPGAVTALANCDVEDDPEGICTKVESALSRIVGFEGVLTTADKEKLAVVGYRPRAHAGDGWTTVGEAAVGLGLGLPGSQSLGLSIAASSAWEIDLALRHQRAFGKNQLGATLTLVRQASYRASVFERLLENATRVCRLQDLFRPGWRQGAAVDLLCGSWLPVRRRWRATFFLWWFDGKIRRHVAGRGVRKGISEA
jgi:hypothetical protein